MASSTKFAACFLACFVLTGCAASDLMVKRQTEVEARVEQLLQADKSNRQYLNEQAGRLQTLEEQLKASSTQIAQAQETIRELRSAQDELKARQALLALRADTPKIAVVNQEPVSRGKDNGPPVEYVKAFGLYSANNFKAAISAFETFLQNPPHGDYAANAQYWIGECYYSLSDLANALAAFNKVTDSYPKSAKAPDALLKQGYTLSAMKEKSRATAIFESLVKSYPGSPAAVKARERLTSSH